MPDEPVQSIDKESMDEAEELIVDAASEPADISSVFGSNAQPQGIYDEKIVGNSGSLNPAKDDPVTAQYDPENDPRMTNMPQE